MSPAVRISLGLVALTVSLLITADALLGLFPDERAADRVESRVQFGNSLSRQLSSLAELEQPDRMFGALRNAASDNDDVLSLAMLNANGTVLFGTDRHAENWVGAEPETSTPTHMRLPIFSDGKAWGEVQVAFALEDEGGWVAWLQVPLYRLLLVTVTGGFALYLLFMRRTLRYLDPSAVVPGRVRSALDQLAEGVVIMDTDLNVVMANAAFAEKLDETPEQLMGKGVPDFDWALADATESELPWDAVCRDGLRRTDVRLELKTPSMGVRSFSANVTPVQDGSGAMRGLMASFDDVSEVQRANAELQKAVERLELAQTEIKRKNDELEILATRDPLTGCFNRRAFFERLETEFGLAARDGLPLSCIMADIDHFKRVNDTFGHGVGDVVIKQMADTLKAHAGANGAVGRYGGEEFCVLLPGLTPAEAAAVAERIRTGFSTLSAGDESATGGQTITTSLGVSAFEFAPSDAAAMVDQADRALYHAKTHGRDQVTIWSPELAVTEDVA